MRWIKIPPQDFALKMQGGGLCARGAYLRDTTVNRAMVRICTMIRRVEYSHGRVW